MTFDIGPGEMNWTALRAWPGMEVGVFVGLGVGVSEGSGVSVGSSNALGTIVGVKAIAVSVPNTFADSAVKAMTVGKYSGG